MKLLGEVRKKFGEVNAIVSTYSMTLTWADKDIHNNLGYDAGELENISIRKLFKLDSSSVTKIIMDVLRGKREDTQELLRKDGKKIKMRSNPKIYIFEKEPFIIVTNAQVLKGK